MADTIIDTWADMMRPWLSPLIAAPDSLTQSILPMSFLTVNETNSGSPSTEAAIVAQASYGRQIGRLVDAVEQLIAERPASLPARDKIEAFEQLDEIAELVDRAKVAAAGKRLEQMATDLALLKAKSPKPFNAHRTELLDLLATAASTD